MKPPTFIAVKIAQVLCAVYILVLTFSYAPLGLCDPTTGNIIDGNSADNTKNGVILINVSSRELPLEELDLVNDVPGRKLRTEEINGYKWTIQTIGIPGKHRWGYHASTYLKGGTIRLTFTFNSRFIDDSDEFVHGILSTYIPLK